MTTLQTPKAPPSACNGGLDTTAETVLAVIAATSRWFVAPQARRDHPVPEAAPTSQVASEVRRATGDDGDQDPAVVELCCAQDLSLQLAALQADNPPQLPTSHDASTEPAKPSATARR